MAIGIDGGVAKEVTRRDPADGTLCTFAELGAKYAEVYTVLQLHKYWDEKCVACVPATSKTVFVVRHGEAQHQNKKSRKAIDALLGPALTALGQEQARVAAHVVQSALSARAAAVQTLRGGGEALEPLFVTSNLLRGVETACCVASKDSQVVVQPLLRERIADQNDNPVDFAVLQTWLANHEEEGTPSFCLGLYTDELLSAGSSHEMYIEQCWAEDCVRTGSGQWSGKENKEGILSRAARLTTWLEEQAAPVIVLVGHSCFLAKLTKDTFMDNGEVRRYLLCGGKWTRAGSLAKRGAAVDTVSAAAKPRGSLGARMAAVLTSPAQP